jgi:methylase of polypeptide subunit release factors
MDRQAFEQTYRLIQQLADPFTGQVRAAARTSHNEAEFRTRVTRHIEDVAARLGVELTPREEYTLVTGRADAVYNRVVIEYEPPGSLRPDLSHRHTQHAVNQVKGYIEGIARREKFGKDRLLGVALDGGYYVFVRYREGHWYPEPPLEVTTTATARFLRALFSLASGRALIPENLVEDFGAQSEYSHQVTQSLYQALEGHSDDLVGRLFQQWQTFFSEVSGYDEATARLRDKQELRQFAKGMGLRPETTDPPRLFFAIHTYFSFLVKAIARLVLERHAGGTLGTTPLTVLANLEGEALRRELSNLESGGIFRALGLQNLLEGDFFAWYLPAWNDEVEEALKLTLARLAEYNPATIEEDPFAARDLLKKLYHYLLPRELRHDLGEYYTPDWLAERVLRQLGEPLFVMPQPGARSRVDLSRPPRLLDPGCGSGTFPVLAIRALKAHCLAAGLGESDTLEIILRSVVGIDLNPLAVLAARVNYLLAIADLVPYRRRPIEIPVYLADSILTPTQGADLFTKDRRVLKTSVGELPVPAAVDTREEMEALTTLLEEYVRGGFSADVFVQRARTAIQPADEPGPALSEAEGTEAVLRELFKKLSELERQGLNGVWARVLKNAFMPLFLEPFDYVAGNPPWVNWESLPDGYRREIAPLWAEYALFPHKGFDAILGKSKDDISILMTYVAADRYLKGGGKLAFVITQSVFKTAGAGQGFRRFRIGQEGPHLRMLSVDDMSELQPFEGATNRTSIFVLQKGQPTRYPVTYTYWKKAARGKGLDYDSTLEEVMTLTRRLNFRAMPVNADDPTSAWLTARERALRAMQKVLGPSDYRAYEGVNTGGANAVYWVEIVAKRPDGLVVVRNITGGAKREVESVTVEIEPDLLYPLLRGRDVRRWQAAPSAFVLVTHLPGQRLTAVPEEEMQRRWPKTWAYLKRFERVLWERKSQAVRGLMEKGPFYSMFAIGNYTFEEWKVMWREVSTDFAPAVAGPQDAKVPIPDHTLVSVSCEGPDEAHYVCSLLASSLYNLAINAYIAMHPSPHVLRNVRVLKFDPANPTHQRLAELSRRAHELAAAGDKKALKAVEAEVDQAAAELWGITAEELAEIRRSLEELRE